MVVTLGDWVSTGSPLVTAKKALQRKRRFFLSFRLARCRRWWVVCRCVSVSSARKWMGACVLVVVVVLLQRNARSGVVRPSWSVWPQPRGQRLRRPSARTRRTRWRATDEYALLVPCAVADCITCRSMCARPAATSRPPLLGSPFLRSVRLLCRPPVRRLLSFPQLAAMMSLARVQRCAIVRAARTATVRTAITHTTAMTAARAFAPAAVRLADGQLLMFASAACLQQLALA